jgi:heme A synthase
MTVVIHPNASFPRIRLSIPASKKINIFRLLTIVMLAIYSIGIILLIYSFPIPAFVSLGAGMLAVLCMAFLCRQRPSVEHATQQPK